MWLYGFPWFPKNLTGAVICPVTPSMQDRTSLESLSLDTLLSLFILFYLGIWDLHQPFQKKKFIYMNIYTQEDDINDVNDVLYIHFQKCALCVCIFILIKRRLELSWL